MSLSCVPCIALSPGEALKLAEIPQLAYQTTGRVPKMLVDWLISKGLTNKNHRDQQVLRSKVCFHSIHVEVSPINGSKSLWSASEMGSFHPL